MKNNKKKNGLFSRSFINKAINFILIAIISISCWEIGKKQVEYAENDIVYDSIDRQKQKAEEEGTVPEFLEEHQFDWINISNTAVDYPLVQGEDNNYYIKHNYKGEETIAGAIFYDAYDEPFNETCTIIYGHSMKNGSMFNSLHNFQQDRRKFDSSVLTINTADGEKKFKPLGYYVTNDDFFYLHLDEKMTHDAVEEIRAKSEYFIEDTEIVQGAHIMALYTCDYTIKDGRLIVFYIEDTN